MDKKIISGTAYKQSQVSVKVSPYREKADATEFEEVIEKLHIRRLFHFTPLDNLASIIKTGHILSRKYLEDNGLAAVTNDPYRWDGELNHINTSLTLPNLYLYNCFQGRYRGRQSVLLELDPALIYKQGSLFTFTNAGSAVGKTPENKGLTLDHFKRIFEINVDEPQDLFNRIVFSFTIDTQAEVMVEEYIPLNMVKAIHTDDQVILTDLKERKLPANIPVEYSPHWFELRSAKYRIFQEEIDEQYPDGLYKQEYQNGRFVDLKRIFNWAVAGNKESEAYLKQLLIMAQSDAVLDDIEMAAELQRQTRLAELEADEADDPNHPDFEEYEELRDPYPWEKED